MEKKYTYLHCKPNGLIKCNEQYFHPFSTLFGIMYITIRYARDSHFANTEGKIYNNFMVQIYLLYVREIYVKISFALH